MRKRIGLILLVLFIIGMGIGTAVFFFVRHKAQDFGPLARERLVHAIEERFNADADLQSLQISLYPRPQVIGTGLTVRHKNWSDPSPLISIRRFVAQTDYDTVVSKRNHVDLVRLEGLEIHIPRRGPSMTKTGEDQGHEIDSDKPGQDRTQFKFLIEKIIADGTTLRIDPKKKGKDPLVFDIQKLTLRNVGPGQPMAFEAKLINDTPPGLIDSSGSFGPWQRDDPRSTAVSGKYTFNNADLGVFKGIAGTLSSVGQYQGVLQEIVVDGSTDTPNFALKRGGDSVHLVTKFHSVVDGTDGDTILDPVDARFDHSEFICRGGIVKHQGQKGKTVSLDALAPHGRIEDILRLVVGGRPALIGAVDFRTKIVIPPGKSEVLDKLHLNGRFTLQRAEFTSPDIQRRLVTLSNRARGISKNEEEDLPVQNVASDFEGRFRLNDGVTRFSVLEFSVPGAAIQLKGAYNLRTQAIDMDGKFRMQSTLADTQSGVKHWVLKPFDRFFQKNGAGFEVPISVTGSKNDPEITAQVFHRRFTIH
jgi:hypothetical protein